MSSKPFTVELPVDLAAKIDEIAARSGITREDAMEQLLRARLEDVDAKHRMTLEGLHDVDAGRVVSHESVQASAASIAQRDRCPDAAVDGEAGRVTTKRHRKRTRLPRGWAQGMEIPPPEPKKPPKRRRKDDGPIVVTDDWPEVVPIGDDELRIIEGYMRKELDELFGPMP